MENSLFRITFADSSLPVFKENKSKGFVTFGQNNDYPNKLIELFNKSPKHGAIVTQKASFLAGEKTEVIASSTIDKALAEKNLNRINAYESFDELKAKICQDAELFNGFAIEVIWNKAKTAPSELYHLPFQNVRVGIDGGYMYSDNWEDRKCEIKHYPAFNPTTRENKQIYYFKFYRAGQEEYPLPEYVSCLKYIEIDTEIANFHLNSIKTGFSAQTLVQLFKGQPTPEEARKTIKRFKENFTGTDVAGGVIIQFNDPNEQPSQINNLTPSDFDKMFLQLNQSVQQEIFSGHRVTSPMLFGIKTEGQLGGRSELIEAYEAFQTSYVEPRQIQVDRALTSIFYYIAPVKLVTKNRPVIGIDYINLFEKGVITQAEARKELGMSEVVKMSENNPFGWDDDRDVEVFQQFGEDKSLFEDVQMKFATALELLVLQYLGQNEGITIADVINYVKASPNDVLNAVNSLLNQQLIEQVGDSIKTTENGLDELKNSGLQTEIVVRYEYGKSAGVSGAEIIPTSRAFCKRVVGFNKFYTREDIDAMSDILGIDVWKRRGGWMTVKNSSPAVHLPYCRHSWIARTVRRKI